MHNYQKKLYELVGVVLREAAEHFVHFANCFLDGGRREHILFPFVIATFFLVPHLMEKLDEHYSDLSMQRPLRSIGIEFRSEDLVI